MFEAARIHDPIEHTFALAGFIAGAVLAAIIIIAAAVTVCTGGLGAIFLMALLASLAPSLPSIGEAIGKMFGSTAGMIITGARNVYTNKRKSALVSMSQVMCDKHSPQQLMAEGSPNVFIHRLAACRKDDRTTCDAKVSDGSGNVFIHGTPVQYLDIQSEVPDELRELVTKLLTYLEYATMILGLGALVKGLIKCVGGKLAGVFSKTAIKCVGKFATGIAAGVGGSMAGSAIGNAVTTSRVAGGQVGNPVEITTGRKILHPDAETDLVLNAPLPLAVARFYSSQLDASSMLGQGWRLPWESRLIQQPDHLLYLDEQGRDFKLPLLQAGERFAAPGEAFSLARLNDGRWVIADLHGTHWLFAASNPQRPEQLALSIIEDSLGHQIRHHYDDNGQLSAISDSVGNRLQLHYHSITLPSGPVIRLAALEQTAGGPGGVRVRYDYDEHARLTAVHDAQDNCQRRFAWGDDGPGRNLLIRHDNALGLSCHYRWDDFDGLPRVVEHSTSDGEHFHFTYDLPARSGSATNAAGHTVHWRWSEQLDILWCQDYDGAQYGFDYDALGQLTALRMPGHSEDTPRQWLLEYDELGRVVRETSPSGRSVSRSYCPDSLRVQTETDALGATWQYQYEPVTGVILRSTDPLGQQTTWHWENPFGPSAITDAKGNTTRYDWGPRGELLAYTDCSGKLTRYSYDSRGQLSSHSNALGETTLLHYDELGQLSQIQHPDGSREQFDYNALGQPLRHRNANGQLRHWRYTPRGLLHRYTDEGGHDTVAEYDALLQLCRLQHGQLEYRFAYAAGGRLEREQRPDQTSLQYRHAPGGELLERQRHGSDGQSVSRTRYQWDADGFLLEQAHEHASVA
uniref:DUF6531 domain-containing protein n=1 Tax=Chitinilyticum litopenaei TaxID=1121276 RepID=UPI000491234C